MKPKTQKIIKERMKTGIRRAGLLLALIVLILLSTTLTLSETTQQKLLYLSVEKPYYELGEKVTLIIAADNPQDYGMNVYSNQNFYKYGGELKNNIDFYPKEEGPYRVELTSKATQEIVDAIEFFVGKPAQENNSQGPNQVTNITNGTNVTGNETNISPGSNQTQEIIRKIFTDKETYIIGEPVIASVSLSLAEQQDYKLYYEYEGFVQRYMGDFREIKFVPRGIGTHYLILRDNENNEIERHSFEVAETSAPQPPSNQPSFSELLPEVVINETCEQAPQPERNNNNVIRLVSSKGIAESATTTLYDQQNNEINLNDSNATDGIKQADLVEIIPENRIFKRIVLKKLLLNLSRSSSLGVDEIPSNNIGRDRGLGRKNILKAFAIDASALNFTNGTLTGTAKGTELWKCKEWEFETQTCLGTWSKVMDLMPGQDYELEISPDDPGYAETGVASINTKKPIYYPNETAEIIMVVLNTTGHLVSNANVTLTIAAPDNDTVILTASNGEITETEKGIYQASYAATSLEGNYGMTITAIGDNVNSTMFSTFTVRSYYEFDIIRNTPVTTDPWLGPIESSITIISHINSTNATTFNFTEVLPASFEIINSGGAIITNDNSNNKTLLTWAGLSNNSVVNYSTNLPLVTPELYQLGPSFVSYESDISNIFYEARPWFLAVDPIVYSADLEGGTIQYRAGTQTEFFYDPANSISATYWNNTNDGDWAATTGNACNGTAFRDNLTGTSYLQTLRSGINTTGYSEIELRFTAHTNNLDGGESLDADWNSGSGWTNLFSTSGDDACGGQESFDLTSAADNNPNFQIRFVCDHNAGTGERCVVDDIRLLGMPPEAEINKTATNYTNINIAGLSAPLLNITIIVYVSAYNNSISAAAAGNNAADLDVSLYNGSSWIKIGKLGITGTGNYSISTTDPTILAAWVTQANRDLSIRGIYLDYRNSTARDFINYTGVRAKVNYSEAPTVNINTSLDEFFTTNTQPNVDFNFTDHDSPTANCTLYFDDQPYGTNNSAINNTRTIITANSSQSQANHSVYVNCTGVYGSIGKSSIIHIIIDNTAPTVNAIRPANDNITNNNRPNFFFNYTDTLSPTANCTLHIEGSKYGTNSTARNYTQTNITANATLADGTYSWNITCADRVGNYAGSTERNITVDTVGPNTTLNQPANFTNITTTTYTLDATVTDVTGVDTVTFEYRPNSSAAWIFACSDNRGPVYNCDWDLTGLQDSITYEIRAYANDIIGNRGNNDTRYNITVDINGPTTTIQSPQNGTSITVNTYILNATAIDPTGVDTVTFLYRQNSTDSWHFICSDNRGPVYECTWNLAPLPSGTTYEVMAYANDTRNHFGNNDTRYNITVNVLPLISNTKCRRTSGPWVDCTTLVFDNVLDSVRTNCTSASGGTISNVSFIMRNIEDNKTYFNDTVNSTTGSLWVDNFTDFTLNDSGTFNLQVICRENTKIAEQNTNWTIPWGTLEVELINPNADTNVTQNRYFNFTSRVTCVGGECGNVSATLDPGLSTISPSIGTADNGTVDNIDGNDDVYHNYTSTWAAEGSGGNFYVAGDGTTTDNALSYIVLIYNLTALNTPAYNINRLTFNVSYCHSGDNSAAAVNCNGADQIEKAFNGIQHVDIYNWTSGAWVNIGELTQDLTEALRMLNFTVTSSSFNLSDFINSSMMVSIRYEANFQSGGGDGFLAIDYAPLIVNFTQKYKSGIIPTTVGAAPFYTITANPMYPVDNSCLANMISGTTCDTTWTVNATGEVNTTHLFWVIYDSLNYSADVSQVNTTSIYITIITNIQPTVSSLSIIPDNPIFTDNINCTFTVTDPNPGDSLTASVDWYKNGIWQLSQNYSVTNGVQKTAVLGSGNLSIGDTWHCGVTPYDQELYGSQVNSSQVTVLATRPPTVSDIQCLKNNAIWGACSAIIWGQNLTQVRAICNSSNTILNASFSLRNVEDDYVFFSDTTTDNSSGYYTLNNPDVYIQDSGTFILNVTCVDANGTEGYGNSTWTVPWGTLTVNLVYPNTSVNVTQNKFFNFTSSVSCSGGECGYVLATLDPTATNLVAASENHSVNPSETWTSVNGLSNTYTNNGGASGTAGYYIFGLDSGTTVTSHNITIEFDYNLSSLRTTGRQIKSATFQGELYITGGGLVGPEDDAMETDTIGNSYVQFYNGTGWENMGAPFINADSAFETGLALTWDQTTDTNPENPLTRNKTSGFNDDYINSSGMFRVRVFFYNVMMDGTSTSPDAIFNWDYAWLTLNYTTNTKGVIPMYSGTPFYTITQNPANSTTFSCLANMKPGSACNTTWEVNATGTTGMPWEFFVTYQSINYSSWVNTSITRKINITIISNIAPNVTSISIAPTDPLPTENLNCTFTITDPNYFDTLTANITWYKNNISNFSRTVSVSNGVSYLDILGSGNLTLGESWKCGVTPYDQELYGSQRNSSSVTIVLVKPPTIQQVQCLVNNSVWMNCQNISFGSNFSGVRANCTTAYNPVTNVTFNFSNTPDARLFFQNTTNTTVGGWYYYYQNITINDSGEFILNVVCSNNESATDTEMLNWTVPWGKVSISLITPNTNRYVEYNKFFNFTANISCRGGECGELNAILDPISGSNPFRLTADNGYVDQRDTDDVDGNYTSTWVAEGAGGDFFVVGDATTFDNAYSYLVLLYNLSQTGLNNSYINQMIFNVSYCHSGDNSAAAVNCNGLNPIEKAFNGPQNVDVYDWASGTWVNIGTLTQDTTEALRMLNYSLAGNFSRYINSSKWVMVRYLGNFTGAGGDGFLAIDYAPLTVNYAVKSGAISTTIGAIPFYTTIQNPANSTTFGCLAGMSAGSSCNVTWLVNATGLVNTTHEFYVISNGSTYSQYIVQNESKHIWLTIQDTSKIPPVVTLNYPPNNTATQNTTIVFNCSATSVSGLTTITLYADFDGFFQENETVSTSGLYNSTSFTRNLTEGKYTWNCKAVDINGNENFAANRTLAVDRSSPFITLSYPNEGDSISSQTVIFNLTVFDNIDSLLLCNLTIDGEVWDPNFSANNGTLTNRTVVGLGRGDHAWNVSCIDDAGNYNISETRNFTVVNIPPNITLLTIDNYMTNAMSFELYYIPNDTGDLLKTDLYINGTLFDTDPAPLNGEINSYTISGLDEGRYNWTVNVTNDADLTAEAPVRWFYIDRQAPTITLHFPPDNYSSNSSSITFNFTAIDSISSSMNCQININGSITSVTATNSTPKTKTITGINDGLNYWNVSCTDNAGNMNTSETRMLNVSSPPIVTLNSPADNYSQTSPNINLTFTPSDSNNITNCSLILNGALNQTNTSIVNNAASKFVLASLAEGAYNWSVNCTDNSGLIGSSATRRFSIDSTQPYIILNSPLPRGTVYGGTVIFNFTTYDNVDLTLSCNLTVDGNLSRTNIPSPNGQWVNVSVALNESVHYWNVSCMDDAGNRNTSETRNFTLIGAPTVTILFPSQNAILNYTQNINFTYIPSSTNSLNLSLLYINGTLNQTQNFPNNGLENYFFVNFSDGRYTWFINITDSVGLNGTSGLYTLTIDSTPPIVSYNTPSQDSVISNNNVTFRFNVTDNIASSLICNVTISGIPEWTNINVSNGATVTRYKLLNDSNYNWSVTCFDNANNTNTYVLVNFTVEAPPNVTLNWPGPNYRTKNQDIMFNFTPRDAIGLENCTLIINNSIMNFTTTVDKNVPNYLSVTSLAEGNYNWTVECIDSAPDFNVFRAPGRNLSIDLSGPIIIMNYPNPSENINSDTIKFNWTATDYAGTNVNCSLYIDGIFNRSIVQQSGSYFTPTIGNFTVGYHNWSLNCSDDLNNSAVSEVRDFYINQPDLLLDNSRLSFNNTNPDLYQTILIRANVSNIGGLSANDVLVEFWDNGMPGIGTFIGNATATVLNNVSVWFNTSWNITPGYHTIYVLVDPYNNITEMDETNNNASINISVLASNITSPENNTLTNDNTPTIHFNVTDYTENNITYKIYVDGVFNSQTGNVTSGSDTSIDLNTLGDGTHLIKVQATDTLGRSKNSSSIGITIDTQAPIVRFETRNGTWFNYSTPLIQFNISDTIDTNINYTVYVNGSFDQAGNITRNTSTGIYIGPQPDGSYNITIQATDDANNSANYSIIIFIDTTKPDIILTYPDNSANFTNTSVYLNFTATDNLDATLRCNLTLDGIINRSNFEANYSQEISTLVSGLIEGTHYWNVTCWDNASNINTSETRTFNIFIAPKVNLTAPANGNVSNNPDQAFYFNVSDDTGIFNCSLILNGTINVTKPGSEITNNATNNFTVSNMNGAYLWSVRCFDNTTMQMQGDSENRTIIIDLEAPYPTINTLNYTWFNTSTPRINFTIIDNYDSSINYTFYVNGSANTTGAASNNISTANNLSNLNSNSSYAIILQAYDDAGNYRNSSSIIIYVDTAKPEIILSAPTPGQEFNTNIVQFNFTATDNMAPYLMCNLTISKGINQTNINATSGVLQNITKGGFTSGVYYWNVSCVDLAGNRNISETLNFTILAPDFLITSANISFNDTATEEGKNITIYANIYNIGGSPANNVTVQFWRGDPDAGGTKIDGNQTITLLNNGENFTLNMTYATVIGYNNIFVVVDPPTATNGSIIEENESNNKANNSFGVSLYQVYAGNTTALIDMEKQSINRSLFQWEVANATGSNILVADLEASPSFLSLQAIGRDTSNASTTNDFTDIDTKLGTTNYSDSINRTFTVSGAPIATRNFTIFSRQIGNTPIINSTNTSNFVTGILWDMSDGNTEYNGTQDILFNTEINMGQEGSQGIYDFEIKVPALLRNYNAAGTSVAFYVELK